MEQRYTASYQALQEQKFYDKYGLLANMRTMDYLWREIARLQREIDKLDTKNNKILYRKYYLNISTNLKIQKALYPLIKKQHYLLNNCKLELVKYKE